MSFSPGKTSRQVLQEIAFHVMVARGLQPEFSAAAMDQLNAIRSAPGVEGLKDLRALPWCSIDNDDSRDLDQLSVAIPGEAGVTRILVAIADVATLVPPRTPLDQHAEQNTTSVYTAAQIFPMLPERLSTDLTSLNLNVDRRAIVVDMAVTADGNVARSAVYEAGVRNQAKLAYGAVAAWLEGAAPLLPEIAQVAGLPENLQLQDAFAQKLRARRHERGALALETIQARPVFDGAFLRELVPEKPNRAKAMIEDFMIAANGVTAEFLTSRGLPSIRRLVRTPRNWDRIVALAAEHGGTLPAAPDGRALSAFLASARAADPLHFADLSLSIVKLIGAGEYVVELPGSPPSGHFGLAAKDYTHSTAPNRRFPDLITQRLIKAALAEVASPYSVEELQALALRCTAQEDVAKKVERQVSKSAAAMLLSLHVGELFDGLVTGASTKGTWVRLLKQPVEGKVVSGNAGLQVGEKIRVRLLHVDVDHGYLDFARTP
jgi:exoribonuclease-2